MPSYDLFISLAVALGVGLLIGLEREQSADEAEAFGFLGGARTHPIFAMAGALSVLLAGQVGFWIVAITFLGLMTFVVLGYLNDLKRGATAGITSESAFAISFLLGGLALSNGIIEPLSQKLVVVASLGVAVTTLLSSKQYLHRLVEKTSKADVYATLKFLIVTVIILPLLPDETYGPLDVLNPFNVGLMVVLIAGIGFVGYVAIRVLGAGKGLGLTGLIGGLVSSTSVTLSFAGRAKTEPKVASACALAVISASTIMFPRVAVEVAVVNQDLLPKVLLPLGGMTLGGAIAALYYYLKVRQETPATQEEGVEFSNPFELGSALKFGALYAIVLFVSKAATEYLGAGGTYAAGILAGTTDVDAITLSMANQAKEGLDHSVAATTIMLGAASNTIVKAGLAISLGGWVFGKRIAAAFGLVLAGGAIGLVTLWVWG